MTVGSNLKEIPTNLYLGTLAYQNTEDFIDSFGIYTAAAAAPSSPKENDIWFDTVNGITYRWYVDATSSQWVEFTGGIAGLLNTSPNALQGNTIVVNLGSTPVKSGNFIFAGTGFTVGRPVQIFQIPGPYSGKGTLADEAEMDSIILNGIVISSTQIQVYWNSQTYVSGFFNFCYVLV